MVVLATMVASGLAFGIGVTLYKLRTDPHVIWHHRKEHPFPWLDVKPDQNLKMIDTSGRHSEKDKKSRLATWT
jgi:hypothetical protein